METAKVRTGIVVEIERDLSGIEPGSVADYNSQQFRSLQAEGRDCSNHEFAAWYVEAVGGALSGSEGRIVDFGDVPDRCVGVEIELYEDDYEAGKQACRCENMEHCP